MITLGSTLPQPQFFHNNLIAVYASLGHVSIARQVFDGMPRKNTVSYNTIINTYTRHNHDNAQQAWCLFLDMRRFGFLPTHFTYATLFASTSLTIHQGLYLQALALKSAFLFTDCFVGTAFLGFFARNGCVNDAYNVFHQMPHKNLVTYNAMISVLGRQGYVNECMLMFRDLLRVRSSLSESSFVLSGFRHEDDLHSGQQLHGLVTKLGLLSRVSVANSFVNMYGKCATACLTMKMFHFVPKRDLVTWNTVITALANGDEPVKAMEFICKMCVDGLAPNQTTFSSVIASCTRLVNLRYGEFIHSKIIKNRYETDEFVGSALVNFYAKCDRLDYARRCFDEIGDKNLVSWNALFHGYSNISCLASVTLMREMMRSGTSPNEFSFSSVVKSALPLELTQLHSLVVKTGYLLNEYVTSALMTAYAKNGLTSDASGLFDDDKRPYSVVYTNIIAGMYNRNGMYHKAQELFCEVEDPDIVSWNVLIASCARNGDYKEAFELFNHMQVDRITPDSYTYVSVLSICTNLCNLVLGSLLHSLMIKFNFNRVDIMVCNVMIDMYGKCGSLWSAVKVFDDMPERNVISWTALVSALGLHGYGKEAVACFKQMEMVGFKPDKVAFIAVLSACRHAGLVNDGMETFKKMKDEYAIDPEMEHYLLVVDLMARHGDLKEAEKFILGMPFAPNASIWRSFLDGCNRQRTIESFSYG